MISWAHLWLVLTCAGAAVADPPMVSSLGQRLRCPVCQGMPIGDSPAPMAQDMMQTVRRLADEGASEQEIETFFTARYGAWVLLDPPKSGVGLWVWLLPPMVGAGLLFSACAWVWRRSQTRHPAVKAGLGIAAGAPTTPEPPMHEGESNEDLAAIRREVMR